MLEAMGLRTGIDLPTAARGARHPARGAAAASALYGFTPDAGLPLGFKPAIGNGGATCRLA